MGSPCGSPYCRGSAVRGADLPAPQPTPLQRTIPSVRGPYTIASRLALTPSGGTGMLTRLPSPTPLGLGLGPD